MTSPSLGRRLWSSAWIRRPIKYFFAPILIVYGSIETVDNVVMPLWTRHGQEFELPSLVGSNLEAAQARLSETGAEIDVVERRYSSDHPDGAIIEQRPPAGTPIKPGRTIKVVVSRGSELVTVPRVRGYTVRQAELRLLEVGFIVGGRAPQIDSTLPPATIVGTIPAAGSRLPKRAVVNLLVNEQLREDYTWCPNLVGLNVEEAREVLRARGLLVGRVDRRPETTAPPGTVVQQSAAPGEEVLLGAEIDLVIAREG